ncbi:hypothetical protein [Singulisphaera acidiphila]|uniref:PsbP n=1 Tax=Singulisphaera acidiphila (strain ATCC BAA-1392 / DSM 18658 / VKM B-2454 / MOB10) TaxID=886293 RepID=L0DNK0_SINAD|nr:hypothetical protein [Singulisphaera acidiphila]AGA30413.1 hypothetical protein Sinac_6331 [Singulisphaera acidiphila DSM 18658]
MPIRSSLLQRIALGSIAVVLTSLGADTPTQVIDAGGLTFEAPGSWKASKPANQMRRAQMSVAPVEGDKEPAQLVLFAFPGGAGGVDANIKRWRDGFKAEGGNPPKVDKKVVKGKNVEVTRVEIAGHYIAPVAPGSQEVNDKPNFRLLGGIVQSGGTGYFLRLVGPDKTVSAASKGFDDLLASMKADTK